MARNSRLRAFHQLRGFGHDAEESGWEKEGKESEIVKVGEMAQQLRIKST